MEAATVPEELAEAAAHGPGQLAEAAPLEGPAGRKARRRPGVIPSDLNHRIDARTSNFIERQRARFFARSLEGLAPSALDDEQLGRWYETWTQDATDSTLRLLESCGYGERQPPRSRAERAHGTRREARLGNVLGKLPRSIALRLPTTADTHRDGAERNDGEDIWGPVKCSRTLRSGHLASIAAVCGLWHKRAPEHAEYVECTASELAHLTEHHAQTRVGGKDVAEVIGRLMDLVTLELSAEVHDRKGKEPRREDVQSELLGGEAAQASGPSAAHVIPSTPIVRFERRLNGRWVPAEEYPAAVEAALASGDGEDLEETHLAEGSQCPGHVTLRIYIAEWARAELAHPKRRPVFVNFDVWRHLRPSARRSYAFSQGVGSDDYDGRLYLFLGSQLRYTLGLCSCRLDQARAILTHDLAALQAADWRYHDGFGQRTNPRNGLPGFVVKPKGASRSKPAATQGRSPARRLLREASRAGGRAAALAASCLEDPARVRQEARREAELVAETIKRSMSEAGRGPVRFDPGKALPRRQAPSRSDEDGDDS